MAGGENSRPGFVAANSEVSVPSVLAAGILPEATPAVETLALYDAASRWRPVSALAMAALITSASVALAFGGAMTIAAATGRDLTLANGGILTGMLVTQILMTVGTILAVAVRGDGLGRALSLKSPAGGLRTYLRAFGLMMAVVAVYSLATHFWLGQQIGDDLGQMVDIIRGRQWPLALLVVGLGAPLSEELLFRGFLQTALVPSRLGYWGASFLTTTLWTALHWGYSAAGLVEIFIIGMLFALFLRRTGSLCVTLVCHALYNSGIALALIFLPRELLGI